MQPLTISELCRGGALCPSVRVGAKFLSLCHWPHWQFCGYGQRGKFCNIINGRLIFKALFSMHSKVQRVDEVLKAMAVTLH